MAKLISIRNEAGAGIIIRRAIDIDIAADDPQPLLAGGRLVLATTPQFDIAANIELHGGRTRTDTNEAAAFYAHALVKVCTASIAKGNIGEILITMDLQQILLDAKPVVPS